MDKIKVMIVDDQYVLREMFRMYIEGSDRYELAACINSAAFAPAYIINDKIYLILMDILMNDGSNGLEVAERIKRSDPEIKIIAVTSMLEANWIKKAK